MIRFKQFDVSDIHYAEQIERFQKEHPSAEFVQITDGCTTYEKIWFKYDDSIEQSELNENQQIVLDWLKDRFNETEIKASCTGYLWKLHQSYIDDEADEAGIAYEELSYEEESEVVRVFAEWAKEQERK